MSTQRRREARTSGWDQLADQLPTTAPVPSPGAGRVGTHHGAVGGLSALVRVVVLSVLVALVWFAAQRLR